VIILLVLFSCFSVVAVFGYDNNIIHPGLSAKAIENHNKTSENKIDSRQRAWIIEGSIAEDADPRYINHFYDPTTGKGLNDGLFKGVSAKEWAKKQNSVSGDYSESAIFLNYKNGNKKRAFQGIGHIIHLIQDMSVPAHTRNDSHPKGDPYESWAKQYGKVEVNNDFIYVNNLDFVFDSLATYSNNNFLSKDTVFISDSGNLTIGEKEYNGKKNKYFIRKLNNQEYIYCLYDDSSLVPIVKVNSDFLLNQDYWRMLHPKAVAYSSGIIDYFMREFKEIDKSENKEKQGFLSSIKENINQAINNFKYGFGDTIIAAHASVDNLKTGYDQYEEFVNDGAIQLESSLKDLNGKVLGVISSDLLLESENENKEQGIVSSVSASAEESKQENNNQENNFTNFTEASPRESDNDLENKQEENKVSIEVLDNFILKRVVDGDTIELQSGEKVRYIGIDAPEIGSNECLAFEAMQRNKEMLNRGELKLIKDPSVSNDKYGRLLRYVYAGDTFINDELIKEGLAKPFFCEPGWENCPVTSDQIRKKEILTSYNFAKENNLGLFSGICEIEKEVVIEEENKPKKADVFPVHLFTSGEPEDTPPLAGTGQAPPSTGTGQAEESEDTENTNEENMDETNEDGESEGENTNRDEENDGSSEDEESTGHEEDEDEDTNIDEDDDESSEDEESTGHEEDEDESLNDVEDTEDTEEDEGGESEEDEEEGVDDGGESGEGDGGEEEEGEAGVNYILISQIKISGESTKDEFVELYNFSDQDINLTGYRLSKKTGKKTDSGNEYNLLTSFPETIIKAKGYLLIGHPEEYIGEVALDLSYSTTQSIAADNSVILYSDAGDTVIDLVGFGEASDFETEVFPENPGANQSLIRKASASSTLESISRVEKNSGNGQDSDNNREDFLLSDSPNPRNSQYVGEENQENEDELEEDDESESEEENELSRILIDNKTGTSTPWGDDLRWEHNVSGSDRLLVVTVHQRAKNRIVDSIKYGSLDLNLAIEERGMHSNMVTLIYYLVNPPIGSDFIYMHFTWAGVYGASAISLNSVNNLNPIATTTSHFFQDDEIRTEIEIDKKAMLIDSFSLKNTESEIISDTNQTEIFNQNLGDITWPFRVGSSYKWADAPGTWDMSWDFDYNSVWSQAIVAINPKEE
jgi:endonuclease YncB( thermonuclease family)